MTLLKRHMLLRSLTSTFAGTVADASVNLTSKDVSFQASRSFNGFTTAARSQKSSFT